MTSGKKLAIAGAVTTGVTAYMGYLGAASSWKYYLTVDECVAQPSMLEGPPLRVAGTVAAGSLVISADRSQATFRLAGSVNDLPVTLAGFAPDNLAEQREVMVEGYIDPAHCLRAHKVMTRCASKYASTANESCSQSGDVARRGEP